METQDTTVFDASTADASAGSTSDAPPPQDAVSPDSPTPEDTSSAALLAEFDDIDAPAASEPSTDDSTDSDPSLPQNSGDVPEFSDTDDTQSKAGNPDKSSASAQDDKAEPTADDADQKDEDQETPDPTADWNKLNAEDDAYIKKHLPKIEWTNARKAFKDAAMAKSYLNPLCPASQFVDNMSKKSAMRFKEVETEIIKRIAENDPVALLGRVFEATQDEEGNSDTYQRLLDSTIETNTDYVLGVLKRRGFDLAKADAPTQEHETDSADISDDEIDEFRNSASFQQWKETFPEDAEKFEKHLIDAKNAKAKIAAFDELQKKQQDQADAQKQAEAEAAQRQKQERFSADFKGIYDESVTSYVSNELDKTYGLAVTPEEKEKNPMMAFLKSAKRKLIEAGGMEGSGDFDNDLYEWGKERPAFKQAAEAMVKYTLANEKDNAKSAAAEVKKFAEVFLAERLKTPELKLVDELIQIVARDQRRNTETHEDRVPSSPYAPQSTTRGFLDDIDAIR